MNQLSSLQRHQTIQLLEQKAFDLAIIGGGITGAGIALDAASRGLKVVLVEKNDFASGTSSRSTKLIHGGLRYLKQLEIGLVRKIGSERAIVHQLAPHLVQAEKMLLPLVEGGTYGKLATSFGLKLYDFLAGVEGDDRRKMLSKEEILALEPLLRSDIVEGGGLYAEYRADDSRLTLEIIKTASKYGALSLNYVQATDFLYGEEGLINGLQCVDANSDHTFKLKAKYVVSAAGPWVDQLRQKNHSLNRKHLFLTKGVHLVVAHHRLPLRQAVYFDVDDGRMIFAIPRYRVTYIGTTDTPYKGDINHVLTQQSDVDYLLNATNSMFPTVQLTTADVESSWAGLRPLIYEEGKSASELSRKDEIFQSDSGLISIAGGKLTGYRKMAKRVTDLVVEKIEHLEGRTFKDCQSGQIALTGGPFESAESVEFYIKQLAEIAENQKLSSDHLHYLVANYGRQAESILQLMAALADEPEVALARAELQFCIEHELCLRPLDFFSRRSGRLYFNLPSIQPVMEPLLMDFAACFGWSETEKVKERARLERAIYEATHFDSSPSNASQ